MSREGIITELQEHGISITNLIYSAELVSVYMGNYGELPSAVKVRHMKWEVGVMDREIHALMELTHENIMKMYDVFWVQRGDRGYLVFAAEWCSKDLGKDMEQRKKENYAWKEEELWTVTTKLVSALAYMQRQGYSHRDIKPANIFLLPNNQVKLGDLGSSLHSSVDFSDVTRTVVGTTSYFSPVLRSAYFQNQQKVLHNVYKSDVFSLGVTLYSIAALQTPLWKGGVTNQVIEEMVRGVQYSQGFKDMLKAMMAINEENRGDFLDFERWLGAVSSPPPTEVKPTVSLPHCLLEKCGKPVDVKANKTSSVVTLSCQPYQHLFCSDTCFLVWIYRRQTKSEARCPACNVPVDPSLITEYICRTRPSIPDHPSASDRALIPSVPPASFDVNQIQLQVFPTTALEHEKSQPRNKSSFTSIFCCCCCFSGNRP